MQVGYQLSGNGAVYSEALVDALIDGVPWEGGRARGERCNSLMGPSCLYSGVASEFLEDGGAHALHVQAFHMAIDFKTSRLGLVVLT